MKNDKGVLIFAFNNTEIDYITLAAINSRLVQKNLGLSQEQVTIVTDSHSYAHLESKMGKEFAESSAHYIMEEKDLEFKHKNIRPYKDTKSKITRLSFYNINRCNAYDISPYTETILIDADYLVLSDTLNHCWGHNNELMMSWEYKDVIQDREFTSLKRLHPLGLTMYWATVVYFRKTPFCNSFFNAVKDVKNNVPYYQSLYKWPGNLYRNDYSFSIAAHVMSGFKDQGIPQLPFSLHKSFDIDDVHSVQGENDLLLMVEKPDCPGDFIGLRWKDLDIHIMNKWALERINTDLLATI